jgi:hypothetical protein
VRRFAAVLVVLALLSCGERTPSGPSPGELEVRLTGPAGAGAAILIVEGGEIDTVEAAGYFTRSAVYSGTARRVLVAGRSLSGPLVRIRVPDRRTTYRATVVEIADGTNYRLLDPADFEATVDRPD